MVLISCHFILWIILIAERFALQRLACLRHMSVGISCFRKTGLGGSFGDHVSYFVKFEMVVCGVLSVAARDDIAVLVAMRCLSVDCVLVRT